MTRFVSLTAVMLITHAAFAQQAPIGYDDTPMQPNGKWRVHDGNRPRPPMVTPGVTNDTPVPPPADAVVLLGRAADLSAWQAVRTGFKLG